MKQLLESAVNNELILVYSLIALVVILIVVIIIIDKRESKKKPQNLFDTLNMKIIADPNTIQEDTIKEDSKTEIVELNQETSNKQVSFDDISPIPEVNINNSTFIENLEDISNSIDEEIYHETDLEKTQAQIRVEEINNALKKAQIEEQIQEDKYAKFEEEQEKNAIISYNELKESFDRLYSENEKIQYLEDDEIPINIDELYQLTNTNEKEEKNKEITKVKLDDFSNITDTKTEQKTTSTFKSSPLISPVYGIQKPPVQQEKSILDNDIEDANLFLKNLKELKNNLD